MNAMFDHTISFDETLADVPKVTGTPGIQVGVHTAVLVAVPNIDRKENIGQLLTEQLYDEDNNAIPGKKVPTFTIRAYFLGEGKVDIFGIADASGKLSSVGFNLPKRLNGVRHIEFMNDNKLKQQWIKNKIAELLDCYTPNGTLSYDKIQGKIVQIEFKQLSYKNKDTGVVKTKVGIDWLQQAPKVISPATFTLRQLLKIDKNIELISVQIPSIPAAKAFELDATYEEQKAMAEAKSGNSAGFNPSEFAPSANDGDSTPPW